MSGRGYSLWLSKSHEKEHPEWHSRLRRLRVYDAFEVVKEMQAAGLEWGEGYRPPGRRALAEIIEGRMAEAVDDWLDGLDGSTLHDRRNGFYVRHLLTKLGDIELSVPRIPRFCPTGVPKNYAQRAPESAPEIDRAILAGFMLGPSTRKVGEVLLALFGRAVSAATVSQAAKTLDAAVAAFHARPPANRCKALMLDYRSSIPASPSSTAGCTGLETPRQGPQT